MRIFLKIWIPVALSLIFIPNIQAQNNPPEISGINCGGKYSTNANILGLVRIKLCCGDLDSSDSLRYIRVRPLFDKPDVFKWYSQNGNYQYPAATFELIDSTGSLEPYYIEVCLTDGIDTTCRIFKVRVIPPLKVGYTIDYEGCGYYAINPFSLHGNQYDPENPLIIKLLTEAQIVPNGKRFINTQKDIDRFRYLGNDSVKFFFHNIHVGIGQNAMGIYSTSTRLNHFEFEIKSSDTVFASNQPILLTYTSNEKLEDVRWKITHLDTNLYSKIYKGDSVNVYLPYVGKYNVQVLGLGKDSCSFKSPKYYTFLEVDELSGIVDPEKSEINLYPNPVQNLLNIEFSTQAYHRYAIINAEGRVFDRGRLLKQMDVSFLEPGNYFLLLDENTSIPFVKQ